MPTPAIATPVNWREVRAKYKEFLDAVKELGEAIEAEDLGEVADLLDELEEDYLEDIRDTL